MTQLYLPSMLKLLDKDDPEIRADLSTAGFKKEYITSSQKFIYNTGSDDDEKSDNVKSTAYAMMAQNRFRMPYPIVWMEDPFDDGIDVIRFYLFREVSNNTIHISVADSLPTKIAVSPGNAVLRTDKGAGEDEFQVRVVANIDDDMKRMAERTLREAGYALMKMVVVLNTKGTETEHKDKAKGLRAYAKSSKRRWRGCPYTIIREPLDTTSSIRLPNGSVPRKHFVRGYQWGRHTRPPDEQKWIEPYWRGSEDKGLYERDHYEIKI